MALHVKTTPSMLRHLNLTLKSMSLPLFAMRLLSSVTDFNHECAVHTQ